MSSNTDNALTCSVSIEYCNGQGLAERKTALKTATLRLIRNEFKTMFLEISTLKSAPTKLQLRSLTVHKNFMKEGKASIKFQQDKCSVFLSNAPPGQLMSFLRLMFIKMTGDNTPSKKTIPLRNQLLSTKQKLVEDISPVTDAEMGKVRAKLKISSETTPSPPPEKKRRTCDATKDDGTTKERRPAKAAKRLYIPTPNEDLNVEQKDVLDACLSGKNVFFTGSAGTGKSHLLRKIIALLPPDVTVPTASTGVAACHIGGVTLHSFAGIGTGEGSLQRCLESASKAAQAQIWRKCKHLIIDEISMIEGAFFEKVEAVARKVRNCDKPFGGIHLILCGDFLQLPPVIREVKKSPKFCFQTTAWAKCVQATFELTQVHRQSDPAFISMLNSVRLGAVTPSITKALTETVHQRIEDGGILATRLCSHTTDANQLNEFKLEKLAGEAKVFVAQDSDKYLTKSLDQQIAAPGRLVLKTGAQVMLLKNISIAKGLVNGARGVVVRFQDDLPVVKFRNGIEYQARLEKWSIRTPGGAVLTRRQVPLKLAWAFSIHKSQGLTLDCVEMSLARVFEAGQAYVALSRAQSLKALRILDFDPKQVRADPEVLKFYRRMERDTAMNEFIPLGRPLKSLNRL